jgi:phosphatidate cytidylyltransferase
LPTPQWQRVLTAAIAIPIVIFITIFAPNWFLAIVVGLFSALAVNEFFALATTKGIAPPGRWFLLAAGLVAISFLWDAGVVMGAVLAAALALMTAAIFTSSIESAFGRVGVGLGSIIYCPVMLGYLLWLTRDQILLLFAIIWVGDSAAYYGGRRYGRHLLAPKISPKKTVEGALAGLMGSIIAGAIGAWILRQPSFRFLWISAVTAVAGQIGDLAESVLKRSAGVKDSSSILPGHGGILDRLDSVLFATPVFYWLVS